MNAFITNIAFCQKMQHVKVNYRWDWWDSFTQNKLPALFHYIVAIPGNMTTIWYQKQLTVNVGTIILNRCLVMPLDSEINFIGNSQSSSWKFPRRKVTDASDECVL